MPEYDVVIVGGGAAGLSAARILKRSGIHSIIVLEREQKPGGLPRHSHHPGFGFSQFGIPYIGPRYVNRLLKECSGVEIKTATTVTKLLPDGQVEVADESGMYQISARAVLLTTGIREAPAPARLLSGNRPWGIYTTSAIQQFLHLAKQSPCRNPVVIGTEWVSFSVILTLKNAGIQPVAMLEEHPNSIASIWAEQYAKTVCKIPVIKNANNINILGKESVEGVEYQLDGNLKLLECDAVILTGQFVPEASLVMNSHLEWDSGTRGPVIDQHWTCSDPSYYAAGNMLRAVESSGVSAREGQAAAFSIVRAFRDSTVKPSTRVRVHVDSPFEYIFPQVVSSPGHPVHPLQFRSRVTRPVKGVIRLFQNGNEMWRKSVSLKPFRRICLPGKRINVDQLQSVNIEFAEK